jgi:hypothetical protein
METKRPIDYIHEALLYLEGKKMKIGAISLLILSYLLGRHVIQADTGALIAGIMSVLGFTVAEVSGSAAYQEKLAGAIKATQCGCGCGVQIADGVDD